MQTITGAFKAQSSADVEIKADRPERMIYGVHLLHRSKVKPKIPLVFGTERAPLTPHVLKS